MTKARRMIAENTKMVDAVCEIIDARIPLSSRNPDLDEIIGKKARLIVLNRIDQADPGMTKLWRAYYKSVGTAVIETDSKSGKGVKEFPSALRTLLAEKINYYASRGQTGRKLRVMIVGIPNVGKSSFINRIAARRATTTSDRPGVTKGKQWINIDAGLELLDTPGVLWPSFDNQTVAENLAFTGAVRDEIVDLETLGANFMFRMKEFYPQLISDRYKIDTKSCGDGMEMLTLAAKSRGFLLAGGEYDLNRMAVVLLDEYRGGRLGRITLEKPSTPNS